jgi:type IV pilus assembly protein PilQ
MNSLPKYAQLALLISGIYSSGVVFADDFGVEPIDYSASIPVAAVNKSLPDVVAPVVEVSAPVVVKTNQIESWDVTTTSDYYILSMVFKNELEGKPTWFSAGNNLVSFDFPKTKLGMFPTSKTFNDDIFKSARLLFNSDKTRLVLGLSDSAVFESAVNKNNFVIKIKKNKTTTLTKNVFKDLDFKKSSNGEGVVTFELSDLNTRLNVKRDGSKVLITIPNTNLPKSLEKRVQVYRTGTPVVAVAPITSKDDIILEIESKGLWDYTFTQNGKFASVVVREVSTSTSQKAYYGNKMSLNFQNVDVRTVLEIIADFTGMNVIASDAVSGSMTLKLNNVPWDQALDIVLQSKNLGMRRNNNVIWVAGREEIAARDAFENDARNKMNDSEALVNETIQVNYQTADDLQKLISDSNQRILSKRGSAVADKRTNTLFILDTADKINEIKNMISKVDVPVKQVAISARIVEATDNFARNLGTRFGFNDKSGMGEKIGGGSNAPRFLFGGMMEAPAYMTKQLATQPPFNQSLSVNLPGSAINGSNPGAFTFSLFNSSMTKFINLELTALEADGKGRIISSPKVVTGDQIEATIEQGTEIPYQQATSSGATSVSFKKASMSLKVKPKITPDGNVIMTVDVHKDSKGVDTTGGPSIDTKQINTQVLINNGGTLVIGGIYQEDESNGVTKIPFLGDIPGIGALFKQRTNSSSKNELLIMITPQILDGHE